MKAKALTLTLLVLFICAVGSAVACLSELGFSKVSALTQEVQVSWPYAYFRCSSEIALMDITNPAKPKLVNSFPFKQEVPSSFYVEGDIIYVGSSRKFHCIDVSNIYNLTSLGTADTGEDSLSVDLEVSGNFAYVLYPNALVIIDINKPTIPSVVSNTKIFSVASKMLLSGSTLYVTDQYQGLLYSVDVTDVSKPIVMDTISTNDSPVDLYAQDKLMYVADGIGGLQIFDISNPYELKKLSSLGFQKWVVAVQATGKKVFLGWRGTNKDGGIYVVDVSDPTKPQLQFELQLYLYSIDLWLDSNKLYYLAHDGNFGVFGFSQCQDDLWGNAMDLGNGWYWLEWFGYFNVNNSPWIYHQEHHWLYPYGQTSSSIVFWDSSMNAFWWTSDSVYPFCYRFTDLSWLWYQTGSSNPRWFYNYTTSQWDSN